MRILFAGVMTATAIAAITLTSGFGTANAGTSDKHQSVAAAADADFSSVRRHRRGRRGVNGALLGAAVVGVIGAIPAQQQYRHRYRDGGYYGGDPRCPNGGVYTWHYGTGTGCY